jgi:hypothetical protein
MPAFFPPIDEEGNYLVIFGYAAGEQNHLGNKPKTLL